ncbi:molybdopterin molybdenumtransferase MoeA [Desulfuromonas versatilis]|uniref:Molybdopterin molybdenumtransferase n=1 Tax=Desulfuromonas versatilis TaxID=2802975 RepID=A0ABM8HS58_9BACT|nr:gephyrin-like molybdotransferase Glp [Desulfuromonas versatilis]BCR03292.1 molybdopterin molybdenumtransferase MoeA [Desulfuromonas versatilis]
MPASFEQARTLILENVAPLGTERVSLLEAAGRILAETVTAPWDMPRYDNSAMDGYAVRAADCAPGAELVLTGYIPAGGIPEPAVEPRCAVKIMTGGPIPPQCDAVVPFEQAEETKGRVTLRGEVRRRDHIRFRGEDIATGAQVLTPGTLLRPAEINLLASFGKPFVTLYRRPRVAILSTGDELVELGERLDVGKIVNSNALSLAAAVKEVGGEPFLLGIARDNAESLREKLVEGLRADVLITSAGVSAGDLDLVRDILAELGVEQVFWKVEIRPGRPTAFGLRGTQPVFSLPGNPVATMITFEEFVRPALLKMMGHLCPIKPYVKAALSEPVRKKLGRVQFLRVCVERKEGCLVVASSGDQHTGILRTMVRANGIATLPADRDRFEPGEEVDVHLITGLDYV